MKKSNPTTSTWTRSPLEKIAYDSDTTSQVINLTDALNAAIDRINELEARYERHWHEQLGVEPVESVIEQTTGPIEADV